MSDESAAHEPQEPTLDPKLGLFLKLSADPVVLVDAEGRIVTINLLAEHLFGFREDELKSKGIEALLPERYHGRHELHLREFFRDPHTRPMGERLELSARRKDGNEIPVEISLHPVEMKGSTVVVSSIRDVSYRRDKDAELRLALEEIKSLKDRLEAESLYLQEEIRHHGHSDDIFGDSPGWRAVMEQVDLVAKTDSSVLITGETGTGKELLARRVHTLSNRADRPLIKVNCAALPETLIEAELFGHEKGAYSGATSQRKGRFELADGGTIFLDEIGDLPSELQSKMLRVLQEGEYERLGSSETLKVDTRVISATNRNPREAMQTGSFRSDLYYRLAVFPIEVPPLRQRHEDIPLLAEYFLSRHTARLGKVIDRISEAQMESLMSYPWPGNVRELENVIERAVIGSPGRVLTLPPLPEVYGLGGPYRAGVAAGAGASTESPGTDGAADTLVNVERAHILAVLDETGWKVKGKRNAAERLGLKESTLRARMKKLGIKRQRT